MSQIDPYKRYTTGQAAKLLGVSRVTVVGRIKLGLIEVSQLPAIGRGTPHRRISGRELLRLLGQPLPKPVPPPAPKRRSNEAERERARAMKRLGFDK